MANISFSVLQKPKGKQGILRPDGKGYYTQVIGGLNIENSASMLYTAEKTVRDLFEGGSTFMRKMERGVLRGENGHPKFLPGMSKSDFINRIYQIYEDRTCVHYRHIWLDDRLNKNRDGSKVFTILAEFTPSGEQASWLERQLANGDENVCFSIRSLTNDYEVNRKIHRDIAEIITFDCVNEPGIAIAEKYKSPALEAYASGRDVLVTQADFEKACVEAVQMGIATESSANFARDQVFKQFGWKESVKTPGWMGLIK